MGLRVGTRLASLGGGHDSLGGRPVLDKLGARNAPALPESMGFGSLGTRAVHLGVEGAIGGFMSSEEAHAADAVLELGNL